jgi:quercetin dioxygenase-like cupin family protein
MPRPGHEIEGPNGYRLRFVRIEPEVLEMEATYAQKGWLPPEHLHPAQAERFEVLEGTIRAVVGGEERTYAVGESFEVPAGAPHQMAAGEAPARMRWEVRPALRTAEFFERLYSNPPDPLALLDEFADEIRMTRQ